MVASSLGLVPRAQQPRARELELRRVLLNALRLLRDLQRLVE